MKSTACRQPPQPPHEPPHEPPHPTISITYEAPPRAAANRRIHQKVSLTFSCSRLLARLVTIHSLPGAQGCAIALDALIVCDQVLGNMTIDARLSGEIPGQAERGRSGTCD